MNKLGTARRLLAILGRFRSAPGRKRLLLSAFFRTWRLLFPIAGTYRRAIIRQPRIVAVVGSFGKTTTARAVYAALGLSRRFPRGWNAGAHLAVELFCIRPSDRHGVIEVGISRRGTMARLARLIQPDIVVVTSIGSEHHPSLGTLAGARNEKAEMVRVLPRSGLAVLNGDDAHVLWMRETTRARVITFGFGEACDVRASSIVFDIRQGTRFTLHVNGVAREVRSRLVGRHMVHPLLAAVAVAVGEGLPLDEVLPRFERLLPAPGRLEVVEAECGAFLLVDAYKSVLETIVASLDTLAELPACRKSIVLGDIEEPQGPQGPLYRDLGARLARLASRVVFVGGRKAYESVLGGARVAGMTRGRIVYAGKSALRAAELVRKDLHAGDIVLIKGRSTQHLERVALHLTGRPLPCDIEACGLKLGCAECPVMKRLRLRS